MQLPMGVPITLIGANTPTASFVAPQVEQDSLLGFNLMVMGNNGATDPTPFTFYVLVRNLDDNFLSLPLQAPITAAAPSANNIDPALQGLQEQEQQQLLQLQQQPQYPFYPTLP